MWTVLRLFVLAVVAIAGALLLADNWGQVAVFLPALRIDLSLNLALVLLALLFVLLYSVLRLAGWVTGLPVQAMRWRQLQRERLMLGALLDALQYLVAGRFVRARKAAERAIELELSAQSAEDMHHPDWTRLSVMAHLIAAESSHAVMDTARRESHFQQAMQRSDAYDASDMRDGMHIRAARWAYQGRDSEAALQWLDKLPPGVARRMIALRLRYKASRESGQTVKALEAIRLLVKHKGFSPTAGAGVMHALALELLRNCYDMAQLEKAWGKLEPREQALPDMAFEVVERALALSGSAAWMLRCLTPVWELAVSSPTALAAGHSHRLVQLLAHVFAVAAKAEATNPDPSVNLPHWLSRVEAMQKAYPGVAQWQWLEGMLCLYMGLWGKAQQLLKQSLHGLRDARLRHQAWCAMAELAERRQDSAAAQQAWREAARSLH